MLEVTVSTRWWVALSLLGAPLVMPAAANGQSHSRPARLPGVAVGQPAPDFELRRLESDETVHLHTVAKNRPVVLVFGSYT